MIEIIIRSGPPEAMTCPALVCDACRRQVAGRGNILFARRVVNDQRESSPLFVAHKGRCDRIVGKLIEHAYPFDDGWATNLWEEAETFMAQLSHNFTHPFADDSEGRYARHALTMPKVVGYESWAAQGLLTAPMKEEEL